MPSYDKAQAVVLLADLQESCANMQKAAYRSFRLAVLGMITAAFCAGVAVSIPTDGKPWNSFLWFASELFCGATIAINSKVAIVAQRRLAWVFHEQADLKRLQSYAEGLPVAGDA